MSKTYQDVAIELQRELDIALEEIIELQKERQLWSKHLLEYCGLTISQLAEVATLVECEMESEDSEDDNSL